MRKTVFIIASLLFLGLNSNASIITVPINYDLNIFAVETNLFKSLNATETNYNTFNLIPGDVNTAITLSVYYDYPMVYPASGGTTYTLGCIPNYGQMIVYRMKIKDNSPSQKSYYNDFFLNNKLSSTEQLTNNDPTIANDYYFSYSPACNGQTYSKTTDPYLFKGLLSTAIGYTYYYGFYFIDSKQQGHFAWISCQNTGTSIRFFEVAYESIPDAPIIIGQKTEPLNLSTQSLITGTTFFDTNNNCIKDNNEPVIANVKVNISPSLSTISDLNGNYSLLVPYSSNTTYQLYTSSEYNTTCTLPTIPTFTDVGQFNIQNIPINYTGCTNLKVSINSTPQIRCFKGNINISVLNQSPIASAPNTLKVVLPNYAIPKTSTPMWNNRNGDTLFYNLSSIVAFGYKNINIIDSIDCANQHYLNLTQCINAFIASPSNCINGSIYTGSDVHIKGDCIKDSIYKITLYEKGVNPSTDSLSYDVFMDNNLVSSHKFKLNSTDSIVLKYPTNGKAFKIIVNQDINHPLLTSRIHIFEGCGDWDTQEISKIKSSSYPYTQQDISEATYCFPIVGSYDPNDKTAYPVYDNNILPPNQASTYKIRFQNTGTAEAYTVVIVDTIPSSLDINKLKLLSTSHPKNLDFIVEPNLRVIIARFKNINLVPKSSSALLSQGYIEFEIAQKDNLPLETVIQNKAYIYFDYNTPIITNMTTQIINIPETTDLRPKYLGIDGYKKICLGDSVNWSVSTSNITGLQWRNQNDSLLSNTQNLKLKSEDIKKTSLVKLTLYSDYDSTEVSQYHIPVSNNKPKLVSQNATACLGASVDIASLVTDQNTIDGSYLYYYQSTANAITNTEVTDAGEYIIVKNDNENLCTDTTSLVVTTQLCTATKNANSPYAVRIYPNPLSDYLMIKSPLNGDLTLLNTVGQKIQTMKIVEGENSINTEQLTPGVYTIEINSEDGSIIQEQIVKY